MLESHRRVASLVTLALLQTLAISCNSETRQGITPTGVEFHVKLLGNDKVDLDGKANKNQDGRIVWDNDTDKNFFVCFQTPANAHPFEALVWYVPARSKRKSERIRQDTNPGDFYYHVYDASTMTHMCESAFALDNIPKIIIQ
jgi:hypothetical protein